MTAKLKKGKVPIRYTLRYQVSFPSRKKFYSTELSFARRGLRIGYIDFKRHLVLFLFFS